LDSGVPLPKLGAGDVLVKIAYAGVNFIDTYQRGGLYPMPLPFVMGKEGAGVVVAAGAGVKRLKVGARVAFFDQGGYAEYVALGEEKLVEVPDGLSLKDACAVYLQGLTAHYLATSTFPIKKGDVVLVHAGAGGTGALLIQMAKLRGGIVITTVSSEDKAKVARAAGADHVILYTRSDFLEEVMKITDKQGVHCVYDGVGKTTWEKSLKSLRPLGLLVLFGNSSGPVPPLDPLLLSRSGSLFLTRPTLNHYVATYDALTARTSEMFGWIRDGKLQIRIAKEFELAEAAEAHRFLESRAAEGKVLIKINAAL